MCQERRANASWKNLLRNTKTGPVNALMTFHLLTTNLAYDFMSTLTWWHHQMETFSALLALCVGNSPVTGEFPSQRPVTRSFDVFFDLRLNKRLSKQPWGFVDLRRHRAHYDVTVMSTLNKTYKVCRFGMPVNMPALRRLRRFSVSCLQWKNIT